MRIRELIVTHLKRRRAYLQALAVLLVLLRRLLSVVRFRRLRIDLALGTGDPATTGLAKGFAEVAAGLARAKGAPVTLRMRPVFGKHALDVEGEVELSVAPIALARALCATLWCALRKGELRRLAFALTKEAVRSFFFESHPGSAIDDDPGDPSDRNPGDRADRGPNFAPPDLPALPPSA